MPRSAGAPAQTADNAVVNRKVLMFATISILTSTVVTLCSSQAFRFDIAVKYSVHDKEGKEIPKVTEQKFHHGFIMCVIYCMAQTLLVCI